VGYYEYSPHDEWDALGVRAPSKAKAVPLLQAKWAERFALLEKHHTDHDYSKDKVWRPKRVKRVADPKLKYGPKLPCCKKARRKVKYGEGRGLPIIMLRTDFYAVEENREEKPAFWAFRGTRIKYCPFCGTRVPKVERNPKPPFPTAVTGDGNYCSTCDQRLMCCRCNDPAAGWRIVEKVKKDPQPAVEPPKRS
jgi:hypothetical protein